MLLRTLIEERRQRLEAFVASEDDAVAVLRVAPELDTIAARVVASLGSEDERRPTIALGVSAPFDTAAAFFGAAERSVREDFAAHDAAFQARGVVLPAMPETASRPDLAGLAPALRFVV